MGVETSWEISLIHPAGLLKRCLIPKFMLTRQNFWNAQTDFMVPDPNVVTFVTAYHPNYTALTPFPTTVGIGELSRNSLRYDVAHNLARNLNAQLLYFPGSYNCPRDLPTEFAFLSIGILASQ